MGETAASKQPKLGRPWLNIATRILVAIVMFIAALGFFLNLTGIVGVWYAHTYTRAGVTDVEEVMEHTLQTVEKGLGRVNTLVQNGRAIIKQVNDETKMLGNRIQANSPVITRISQLVNNALVLRIENARTASGNIHDAVVAFNALLVSFRHLPGIAVPALNNALSALSERAQEIRDEVQGLSAMVADVKAGIVAKAQTAITNLTGKIDAALVKVQQTISKYQTTVTHTQDRIVSTSNTALFLIGLSAVLLTLFSLMFAAGQALLTYVCWRYVRTGRFPTLRVTLAKHTS